MLKTILVPLDGSAGAEAALTVAARIARNAGGSILLVRAVSFASDYWPAIPAPYPAMAQTVVETEQGDAHRYLSSIAASNVLADRKTIPIVQFGPAVPTILSVASTYQADLIVLSHHTLMGVGHWLMGSAVEKLVRCSPIPLLILHEAAGMHLGGSVEVAQPFRVLVPLDGSAFAKAALEPAAALLAVLTAPGQKGAIHLVRVVTPAADASRSQAQLLHAASQISRAKSYLARTTEHLREGYVAPAIAQHQYPVSWSVATDMDTAKAIVRIAEHGDDTQGAGAFGGCDLIALATHGREGLQRWAMGSIAERLLRATRSPLFVVPAPEKGAAPVSESGTEGEGVLPI